VSIRAEAWFLYPGKGSQVAEAATLVRETFEFPDITDDEVLVAPVYGCWEGNMGHALERRPVDLCHLRNEPRVILGNAGVVRVIEAGTKVHNVEAGQHAVLFGSSIVDRFGYPEKIFGYDAPSTMGCLSTKLKLKEHELVPIPGGSRHALEQWAAFSVRYITAWSNWRLAYGTLRLLLGEDELAHPNVWGWGGGTTLAELDLAKRFGCDAVMLCGSDKRIETIAKCGVTPLDRRQFGDLAFDEKRFATEPVYRRSYNQTEARFLAEVKRRTSGAMVQIFVDHIGSAVFRSSLKALGREGILTTAGWKTGMTVSFLRAMECIDRHQHIHTHYARYREGVEAIAYAEREGWVPPIDERVYSFDEIPEMAEKYLAGDLGMFPIYSVNPS
jgi:NADPH:quinone reductase-like Zn-dependent oxidoreductase